MRIYQMGLGLSLVVLMSGCQNIYQTKIPAHLLQPPDLAPREIKTQNEAGEFMLEILDAYEHCKFNLMQIKEFSGE